MLSFKIYFITIYFMMYIFDSSKFLMVPDTQMMTRGCRFKTFPFMYTEIAVTHGVVVPLVVDVTIRI